MNHSSLDRMWCSWSGPACGCCTRSFGLGANQQADDASDNLVGPLKALARVEVLDATDVVLEETVALAGRGQSRSEGGTARRRRRSASGSTGLARTEVVVELRSVGRDQAVVPGVRQRLRWLRQPPGSFAAGYTPRFASRQPLEPDFVAEGRPPHTRPRHSAADSRAPRAAVVIRCMPLGMRRSGCSSRAPPCRRTVTRG